MAELPDPIDVGLTGIKTPLQSKTIVTAISGIIAVLTFVGVKLTVSNDQVQQWADAIVAVVTLVQFSGAIYFRWRATHTISSTPK